LNVGNANRAHTISAPRTANSLMGLGIAAFLLKVLTS
jgi:hypothetical protein